MAEAFRRVLWSVPLLGLLTAALFSLLSRLEPAQSHLSAPLFYNERPTGAAQAAKEAAANLVHGVPGSSNVLKELGGAALPTLLSSLPTRPISERRRIADALWPVAQRMGYSAEDVWVAKAGRVFSKHDVPTADEKLVFWERYAEEHATDLTPLSVQRLVKRIATRDAPLRERELKAVDTYALPVLVAALGRIRSQKDVQRARRLVKYIAHASGSSFSISQDASVEEARREVTRIRVFWDREGPKWTQYRPFELVAARVVQTEYAMWLQQTIREATRLDQGKLSDELARGFRISGALLLASLLGLFVVAPLVASSIQVILLGAQRFRFERYGLRLALGGIFVVTTVWSVRKDDADLREMIALAALSGTAFGTFVLQRELADRLDWRTHYLLGRRGPVERIIAVGRWLAPAVPTLFPMALVEATTYVICLETVAGLPGLGASALHALQSGDLSYLMTFCVSLGILTVVLQLLSDLVLSDADSRSVGAQA